MKKNNKIRRRIPSEYSSVTSFPIVGIGGSAGGLEAFRELLKNLPDDTGMSFVFIMHLSPEHESQMAELLSRETKMPVKEAKNRMLIEANHIYVIPPGMNMSVSSGRLILKKQKSTGKTRMPIDCFFTSLAEQKGSNAIGVVLSGTAADGTLGLKAIKAEGGIIFAQDEKSAKFYEMPRNAIASGCVDFVSSPEKIALELQRMANTPPLKEKVTTEGGGYRNDSHGLRPRLPEKTGSFLQKGIREASTPDIIKAKGMENIFAILRSLKGMDFTHYKIPTVKRRIARRMPLCKTKSINEYAKYLRENKNEVEKLYEDLLINVTSFFRDPDVFDALKKHILPAIVRDKSKEQSIRIWVPGCSTGEEAYSIAICLAEIMGNRMTSYPVQIFATDASDRSIARARRGVYDKNIEDAVSQMRLRRFFSKEGNTYKISKQIRDMCVFSRQNVFNDPPFSNIDLVSCRNMLIYLQPVLQKKIFHNLHYAVRPGGFLLLGSSESAGAYSSLFKVLDSKHKIFEKKHTAARPELLLSEKYYLVNKPEINDKISLKTAKEFDMAEVAEDAALREYIPSGVLINSNMEVIHFRGHTDRYLEQTSGKPCFDIFKLAREGIRLPLRAAVFDAKKTKRRAIKEVFDVRLGSCRRGINVRITVIPVKSKTPGEIFFLVLFDEIPGFDLRRIMPKSEGKSLKNDKYVESLRQELAETKEYLQSVIEEYENSNEEIRTTNEEILSGNEELQSTNEELETAKEELQSTNEELSTTNEELQNRNLEVSLLNNDLVNLLSSINLPIVMMDTSLVIRRITPQTETVLNIIPSDIGRPISKIRLNVDIPDLEKTLLRVIETLHPHTFEIKNQESKIYSAYIRPYRTLDNKIDGVLAVFFDVTQQRQLEDKLRLILEKKLGHSEERFKRIFEGSPDGVLLADLVTKKFYMANNAICRMLGYTLEEILNLSVMDIHPEKDLSFVLGQFEKQAKQEFTLARDMPVKRKNGTVFYADVNAAIVEIDNRTCLMGFFHDITERRNFEQTLSEKMLLSSAGELASGVAHDFNNSMQTIISGIDLARMDLKNEKQLDKYLKVVKNAAFSAISRVKQFQRFVGKSATIDELNLLNVNALLEDVISQAKSTWKAVADKEGLSYSIQSDFKAVPRVLGNENELKAAFYNIIKNGIEAMPGGGIILVSTRHDNDLVHISFKDTGIGMTKEIQSKIFQPFFSTKSGTGRGFGMSNACSVISSHKGKIYVKDSAPEKGTTILIDLPAGSDIKSMVTGSSGSSCCSARILLVDDEESIRSIIKNIVEKLGHTVDTASGAKEAISMLEQKTYDILFTDLGMPGINGWELIGKIKDEYPLMKIVIVTGWNDEISETTMKDNHVVLVLNKPVEKDIIKSTIDKLMNNK